MTEKSAPTENVDKLHEHEEKLRAESLALIAKRMDLTDHWKLVQKAMNVIYAFANDHVHGSDDELTLQPGRHRDYFLAAGSCQVPIRTRRYRKLVFERVDRSLIERARGSLCGHGKKRRRVECMQRL
jgi:hypothetical protein